MCVCVCVRACARAHTHFSGESSSLSSDSHGVMQFKMAKTCLAEHKKNEGSFTQALSQSSKDNTEKKKKKKRTKPTNS